VGVHERSVRPAELHLPADLYDVCVHVVGATGQRGAWLFMTEQDLLSLSTRTPTLGYIGGFWFEVSSSVSHPSGRRKTCFVLLVII